VRRQTGARACLPRRDICSAVRAELGAAQAGFLIERVKGGLKVMIKDRPKTEKTVPDKTLNESI
jgi:hypothetical protein